MEKDTHTHPADLRTKQVLLCKERKQVKAIYLAAFPKEERMPFGLMLLLSCFPGTKFLAFYDGDRLCGLNYMGKIGRQAFIMFFAVDEALRSKGYGARILHTLRTRYPNCNIVVSIEPCRKDAPDLALRQRRKAFYLRNGYQDSGYDIKLSGIEQELLVSGGGFHRARFSLFLLGYSCLAIIPRIWKRKCTDDAGREENRRLDFMKIDDGEKLKYMDLLLMADEQASMIEKYLYRGDMFVLREDDLNAICVVTREQAGVYELKNIAVVPECRQQGYGRSLVAYIADHYKSLGRELIVGTGDSPSILRFYEGCGFAKFHTVKNFFTDNYDHPMYEDGQQLIDMVYLKREL